MVVHCGPHNWLSGKEAMLMKPLNQTSLLLQVSRYFLNRILSPLQPLSGLSPVQIYLLASVQDGTLRLTASNVAGLERSFVVRKRPHTRSRGPPAMVASAVHLDLVIAGQQFFSTSTFLWNCNDGPFKSSIPCLRCLWSSTAKPC